MSHVTIISANGSVYSFNTVSPMYVILKQTASVLHPEARRLALERREKQRKQLLAKRFVWNREQKLMKLAYAIDTDDMRCPYHFVGLQVILGDTPVTPVIAWADILNKTSVQQDLSIVNEMLGAVSYQCLEQNREETLQNGDRAWSETECQRGLQSGKPYG